MNSEQCEEPEVWYHGAGPVILVPPGGARPDPADVRGYVVRELASPGHRLIARMIDILVLALGMALVFGLGFLVRGSEAAVAGTIVARFVWGLGYEPFMTTRYGGGVGKLLLGLRVVRETNGLAAPHFGSSLLRFLAGTWLTCSIIGLVIDLLCLFGSGRNASLHDLAGRTVVITAPGAGTGPSDPDPAHI